MTDEPAPEYVDTGREWLEVTQGSERTDEILAYMREYHPELPEFVMDHCLDALYTRRGLTLQQRQLVVISTLVTQGDTGTNLVNHFEAALNVGLTEEELREALLHLSLYAGMPRAINALEVLRDVLADR